MSYDIYCYRSKLDNPSLDEAQAALEIDESREASFDSEEKWKIAKALLDYNPSLETSEFVSNCISRTYEGIIENVNDSIDHIELNEKSTDLALQISIFDDNVCISTPYWYSGDEAERLFEKVSEYTKIIRKSVGYFVYDPQTDKVFDPLIESLFDTDLYNSTTRQVDLMREEQNRIPDKQPWWKFW